MLRSRVALGHALVELMLEREFDAITVQQVLDRAKVGRATFYAHFKDKRDLLLSDAERFLELLEEHFMRCSAGTRRVAPVHELFSHVADVGELPRVLDRSGLLDPLMELFTGHFARIIERRIAEIAPTREPSPLSDAVASRVFAGGLIELMRWWMRRSQRPSPLEMESRFHEIVWGGLARLRATSTTPSRMKELRL